MPFDICSKGAKATFIAIITKEFAGAGWFKFPKIYFIVLVK